VVEVLAPAYRSMTRGKGLTWTVGPVSIVQMRGIEGLMVEGQPTSVVCVPRMKAAIAINGCGLRTGMRVMCPPNLEMMAVPVGLMPVSAPAQGPAYPAYPAYSAPVQQPQVVPEEEPPPPPPD
jgi:hypothetical protein